MVPPQALPTPLVTTGWLAEHLGDPDLRILDASWYLPSAGRDARAEFLAGHIPGARFGDLDAISDPATSLPHMLPPAAQFGRDMGGLGISNHSSVVVYDASGANLSAPRVWWMLKVFGHDAVTVLDGGLGKWKREQRPIESGESGAEPAVFRPRYRPELVRDLADVRANLESRQAQVLDARSRGRFEGVDPEPRPEVRRGHIPGSHNLPFTDLVGPDGTLLSPAELRGAFQRAGIDLDRPVIATCGSGTTACALLLALQVLGSETNALYDGSWSEWGTVSEAGVDGGPSPQIR